MIAIDLTHPIREGMPVYPGTEPPVITDAALIVRDHYREKKICLYSHTGTHLDAPAHLLEGGRTLNSYDASAFLGRAIVVDCADIGEDGEITSERISRHPHLGEAEFILFHTGWDKKWGSESYFHGYPTLTEDAVELLLSLGLKGIGFDTISPDKLENVNLTIHKRYLSDSEGLIIENLTGLDRLGCEPFSLICLPLDLEDADGAPARAVALIDA